MQIVNSAPEGQNWVLREAASVLRKRGWTQFGLREGRQCCAMGAILAVGAGSDETETAIRRLMRHVGGLGVPTGSVTLWNDAPGRTRAQVIRGLLAAARAS